MYTVIRNRVYNTATTTKIADYTHNGVTETLYRKKNGEYFVHFYNEDADDTDKAGWHGKEKIVPYDFETARSWGMLRLDEGRFTELFAGEADATDITSITIRVSRDSLAKLRKTQSETGETMSRIVDRMVAQL
jgi:hypothetical protein